MLFPFPDRKDMQRELEQDILFRKIPAADYELICSMAWNSGRSVALELFEKTDSTIYDFLESEKVMLQRVAADNVIGNRRCFSEYDFYANQILI